MIVIRVVGLTLPQAARTTSSMSFLPWSGKETDQALPTKFPPNEGTCGFPLYLTDPMPLLLRENPITLPVPFLFIIYSPF